MSWLAALLRAANNNRRTCLIGGLVIWHLVRWRRARELEDEERVARAEARIRDERRRRRAVLAGLQGRPVVLLGDGHGEEGHVLPVWNSTTGLGGPDQT